MSDLHCHLDSARPHSSFIRVGALRRLAAQHPVLALMEAVGNVPNISTADALIMPGDLTDRASQEGMVEAWRLTQDVAARLRCEVIVPAIGNHDVDSQKLSGQEDPWYFARNLDESFPFCEAHHRDAFFSEGFCLVPHSSGLQFVVVNSVVDHVDAQTAKRGVFGPARIEALRRALAREPVPRARVAVLHHHPVRHDSQFVREDDVIPTGQNLITVLRQGRCGLVVHGHKHHPRLRVFDTSAGRIPVLAAGSIGAMLGPQQALTKNTFHTVRVDFEASNGLLLRGHVRTWHWHLSSGWRPATEDAVDFPPQAGFGHSLSIDDIVEGLATAYPQGTRWREQDLVASVPDILHLTPGDLSVVRERLRSAHHLTLYFNPQGRFELDREEGI